MAEDPNEQFQELWGKLSGLLTGLEVTHTPSTVSEREARATALVLSFALNEGTVWLRDLPAPFVYALEQSLESRRTPWGALLYLVGIDVAAQIADLFLSQVDLTIQLRSARDVLIVSDRSLGQRGSDLIVDMASQILSDGFLQQLENDRTNPLRLRARAVNQMLIELPSVETSVERESWHDLRRLGLLMYRLKRSGIRSPARLEHEMRDVGTAILSLWSAGGLRVPLAEFYWQEAETEFAQRTGGGVIEEGPPPDTVRDIVDLARDPEPSPEVEAALPLSVEALLGLASTLLQNGAWESQPDVELDVGQTSTSLRNEAFPVADRPVADVIVTQLAMRLSAYVLEATASPSEQAIVGGFKEGVLNQLSGFDGGAEDAERAIDAADWFAEHADFGAVDPPEWVTDQADWEEFVAASLDNPYGIMAALLDWRDDATIGFRLLLEGAAARSGDLKKAGEPLAEFGTVGAIVSAVIAGPVGGAIGGAIGVVIGVVIAILARFHDKNSNNGPGESGHDDDG